MVYIYCALYVEAAALIKRLCLKKRTEINAFQVFGDLQEKYCLVLTGVGMVNAVSAVSYMFALHPPGPQDYLVNFGSCAAADLKMGKGSLYICRKISGQAAGRDFYPDMIYDHSLCEADLITVSRPVTDLSTDPCDSSPFLYDMEAAGIFEAANRFLGPHQMLFLKVVSDHGEPSSLTAASLGEICTAVEETISTILEELGSGKKDNAEGGISDPGISEDHLAEDLKCTAAMREILDGYLHYFRTAGIDVSAWIGRLRQEKALPCKSKKEGLVMLARMRRELVYQAGSMSAFSGGSQLMEEKKDA